MKHLPNFITLSRIILSIALIPTDAFSKAFYIIYAYCGVSDVLDGFLARKFNLSSERGAKLDSMADLLFYSVILIRLFPVLCNLLPMGIWYMVLAILVIRFSAYLVVAIKYHKFASMHTYMNKLTGLAVFMIPFILVRRYAVGFCWGISVIALLSSLEELVIHLISNSYCPDKKSILLK